MEPSMSLADEFARLVASSDFHVVRIVHGDQRAQKKQSNRTQTVYSVGEALSRKDRSNDAKLAASSI